MTNTQINIPDRLPDEPEASAQQLQLIRQLVTGMSLSGFRFDYRKLGTHQAAGIIDQLLKLREAQGSAPAQTNRVGCLGTLANLLNKLGTAVILLLIITAIGGVVYIYFNPQQFGVQNLVDQINENLTPSDPPPADTTEADASDATANEDDDANLVDSPLFEGLKVERRSDPNDRDADDAGSSRPGSQDRDTATPPSDPEPAVSAAARRDIDAIELMLVRLSQFTRTTYEQVDRQASTQAMQRRLDQYAQGLSTINTLNPDLAKRIQAVIRQYAEPTIDAQAMRDEINAIRQALADLK